MTTCVLEANSQRLEVAPWRGGLATSYRVDGQEIFYMDQATFDQPGSVRGGIPVLFPWAGPLPEGSLGTTGKLPQHGLARQAEWEVVSAEPLELRLGSSQATQPLFPWEFELRQRFSLTAQGLLLESTVFNPGQREMPVQLGFHPYFRVEDKARLRFELAASHYRDNDDSPRVDKPFDGTLPLTQRGVDWELRGLVEHRAVMSEGERQLELTWSDHFPVLVIWSLLDKPFVCLEPWSAGRFAQSTGDPDLWLVGPQESATAWWRIRLI